MPSTPTHKPPVVLVVRDGWGENPNPAHDPFNAIRLARTPVDDHLRERWPMTLIHTSGEDVGLPVGTMGNSEVGHQNIGAGRIVDQELMRITRAIHDGAFAQNPGLLDAFRHAQRTGGRVHLLGLASDGQVHSDLAHLVALIGLAAAVEFPASRLFVHAITDGRDTGPFRGQDFIAEIERTLDGGARGRIGTVIGRYYAMDRDHRWERVEAAYACLTGSAPTRTAASAADAVQGYYDAPSEPSRRGDEFILPTLIETPTGEPATIGDGDAVIFFNFRGDRPREITRAFVLDDDEWAAVPNGGFSRGTRLRDLHFCTMADYERGLPVHVAFPRPPKMANILGDVVHQHGLRQLRCAETEKFPHVTFFFNDYREEPFPGEQRMVLPSPRDVTTYDQKPEMSARAITETVVARLRAADGEDVFIVNFANPDMVGHTGVLEATTRAVETVDACVGEIIDATLARDGALVITADHGNAEQMWDPETDAPHTAHTVYDVPLFVVGARCEGRKLRADGRLGDIAPTMLDLLGLPQPAEMTGRSLLA
ncbi:MAG: 2,3-bisphosphoglycerate-independent phosphoglycerate mutase [Planctomycetes bacterium]|nr:2,3-bisphosphoglycerate-independent phosphoglycerate mutase [Planctomycetota bacterium]